jgi:hypothetical protein
VEPFPNKFLKDKHNEGAIQLISKPVQDLSTSFISSLGNGDLFFVDSSHTLGPAGEVTRIILELLPRLNKGVFIHFHDIQFPYDYPSIILERPLFFPHESVLLHAFLTFNSDFKILASLSMLHYKRQEHLREILNNYVPAIHEYGLRVEDGHYPSSVYLQRVK